MWVWVVEAYAVEGLAQLWLVDYDESSSVWTNDRRSAKEFDSYDEADKAADYLKSVGLALCEARECKSA